MASKVAVGIALALIVAATGCQRGQEGGGGGQPAGPQATEDPGRGTTPARGTEGANRPGGKSGPSQGNPGGFQGSLGGQAGTDDQP